MDYGRGAILGLKGFGAAVAGGLGSSFGAVFAGLFLGILEAMGGGYISSHYMDAIALLILITVLFIRPSGLMGSEARGQGKYSVRFNLFVDAEALLPNAMSL